MPWQHTGGGCNIGTTEKHPCDDDYRESETGREIRFLSTIEAHFSAFPPEIGDMDAFLRSIEGRSDIRVKREDKN
jgi:hypothetical protein